MGSVEKRHLGVASAALGTMRLTGQMMSAGTVMMIFALVMGRVPIAPAVYPQFLRSVRIAFLFFAALCVAGVFASLARGDRGAGRRTKKKFPHDAAREGLSNARPPAIE